jgi:hypothetical protein
VAIESEKVVFDVEYDLSVSKEGASYQLKEFSEVVDVNLDEIYNAVSEIMNEQMEEPNSICISCIYDIADKNDFKIRMIDGDEGIVFVIVDEKFKIYEEDYEFYFANKYGVGDEDEI